MNQVRQGRHGSPGIFASATEIMNKSGKPIVSVDIPSGIGTNLQVKPKMTVTFTDSKEGMLLFTSMV